jgi:hypothetical protein|tara:strand:- start:341 stop:448 length:108 start_codon:yes stop_codon:yes gene_type:complete
MAGLSMFLWTILLKEKREIQLALLAKLSLLFFAKR